MSPVECLHSSLKAGKLHLYALPLSLLTKQLTTPEQPIRKVRYTGYSTLHATYMHSPACTLESVESYVALPLLFSSVFLLSSLFSRGIVHWAHGTLLFLSLAPLGPEG